LLSNRWSVDHFEKEIAELQAMLKGTESKMTEAPRKDG